MSRVELLSFDGCRSQERLLPVGRRLAHEAGTARRRVDGRDVDLGADARTGHGLKCRLYRSVDLGQSPVPPASWIRAAQDGTHG